jgi:hypothetical protein
VRKTLRLSIRGALAQAACLCIHLVRLNGAVLIPESVVCVCVLGSRYMDEDVAADEQWADTMMQYRKYRCARACMRLFASTHQDRSVVDLPLAFSVSLPERSTYPGWSCSERKQGPMGSHRHGLYNKKEKSDIRQALD